MSEIIGTVVKIKELQSKDGEKHWQNVVIEDTLGMVYELGHWGKPLEEDKLVGNSFKVKYIEKGEYMNLKGLVPHTITEQQSLPAATEQKEAPKVPQAAPQQDKGEVYIRQTALKCASELISAKVFSTSTGTEGVTALANEFVAYLTDGTMPKTLK